MTARTVDALDGARLGLPEAPHLVVLDELIAWATRDDRREEVIAARSEFSALSGEVFEEERQLEERMAAFLEFFVCDRSAPPLGETPAQARYALALKTESPSRAAAFGAWTETVHGLFEVRDASAGSARLRHLYSGIDFAVASGRHTPGLLRGLVLEARLVPVEAGYALSSACCWHPLACAGLVKDEVRRRLSAVPTALPERELIYDCARRALAVGRARQVPLARVYDFGARR